MGTNDVLKRLTNLSRDLGNLQRLQLNIVADEQGMIDKQCPNLNCETEWKANADDWRAIFKDQEVFCPKCCSAGLAKEYFPNYQLELVTRNLQESIPASFRRGVSLESFRDKSVKSSLPCFDNTYMCNNCNVRFSLAVEAQCCPSCGLKDLKLF